MLFTDTIYENLRVNRDLEPKRIIEVAKLCFVDEIIKNKEFGYNTLIEENGFNLSGGEKQRIILARTLLNDSKIILIDEGTNQLDVSLERKILKNIFKEYAEVNPIFKGLPEIPLEYQAKIKIVNKKPILASEEELKENSRSHSAKLRIIERV